MHAHLTRVIETSRGVRMEFAGGIAVETPQADYDAARDAGDWVVEFPRDTLRVV
jgi:hypothetical protein